MRIGCALGPSHKPLLAGHIHLPGSTAQLTSPELQPRLGVIEAPKLVCSRISRGPRLRGRIAELLHDRDAGIVPEAEIHTVEFIAAKISEGVIRARHRVKLFREFV